MERVIPLILAAAIILTGCENGGSEIASSFFSDAYEDTELAEEIYEPDADAFINNPEVGFLYEDLCYSAEDVDYEDVYDFTCYAAACFNVTTTEVIYSKNIYEKVYPASTTKLMTALVAVRYCDLDDIVTISEDNCGITTYGAQLCGFLKGDRLTVRDLLYCLLIYSGNDAGKALAEYIAGSEDAFVGLMNSEAENIGATDSHFVNSHGLHDANHYTTAYDMYLIFNECLKYETLKDIFKSQACTVNITSADGTVRSLSFEPTNLYYQGTYTAPDGITVFGGKTGDTVAAGKCLILYSEDESGNAYITELFKAESKAVLYSEMNELFNMCLASSQK